MGGGGQLHLNLLLYMKIKKKNYAARKSRLPPSPMLVCACLIYHCKSEDSNFMKSGFSNLDWEIRFSASNWENPDLIWKVGMYVISFTPNKCFSILYIWNCMYWWFYANSMVYNYANPAHGGPTQYTPFALLLKMLVLIKPWACTIYQLIDSLYMNKDE